MADQFGQTLGLDFPFQLNVIHDFVKDAGLDSGGPADALGVNIVTNAKTAAIAK